MKKKRKTTSQAKKLLKRLKNWLIRFLGVLGLLAGASSCSLKLADSNSIRMSIPNQVVCFRGEEVWACIETENENEYFLTDQDFIKESITGHFYGVGAESYEVLKGEIRKFCATNSQFCRHRKQTLDFFIKKYQAIIQHETKELYYELT